MVDRLAPEARRDLLRKEESSQRIIRDCLVLTQSAERQDAVFSSKNHISCACLGVHLDQVLLSRASIHMAYSPGRLVGTPRLGPEDWGSER